MARAGYTKFRAWMTENGVLSKDLSELLDLSENTISHKLTGVRDFNVEEMRIICLKYGISADKYFVDYKVSQTATTEQQ